MITTGYLPSIAKEVRDYGKSTTLKLPEPDFYEPFLPAEFSEKRRSFILPQPFTGLVEGVDLFLPAGVGMKDTQVILDTAYAGRLDVMERNRPYFDAAVILLDTPAQEINGLVFPMMGVWSNNYYHWILDFLPRLEGALMWEDVTVAISPTAPKYVKESLSMLGVKYFQMEAPHLMLKQALIPTTRRKLGYTYPDAVEWLRVNFSPNGDGVYTSQKLYITRRFAERRRVVNEEDVCEKLLLRGFHVIAAETLSLEQQIRVFSGAEVVIAPHGAGLVNACFSHNHPAIMELATSDYLNPCFYTLFSALGYPYGVIICDRGDNQEDIYVNIDQMINCLDKLESIKYDN
jgi:hypothetical protein